MEERGAFPRSAVAVETAIPVFIGYTEVAEWNGKSLLTIPTRIRSFHEYVERFGGAFPSKFSFVDAVPTTQQVTITVNGTPSVLKRNDKHTAYLFNSMRLFYANGGGACYILAIGTYGDSSTGLEMKVEDFTGSVKKTDPFELLKKESEPTLVVLPDAIALGEACYTSIYTKVLEHCSITQNRFGIFDLIRQEEGDSTAAIIDNFRDKIGNNALNYGAAYYPWLKATVVQSAEVSFENLDATVDLEQILPEPAAVEMVRKFKTNTAPDVNSKANYHQALKAVSPTYSVLLEQILSRLNELPPSAAIAGLYAYVDSNQGVWKAPVNVVVNSVTAPTIHISNQQQDNLNVNLSGKSINAIRSFPEKGAFVWGARTLDGNSQDWRYINVRRTIMMIEQSLKLAMAAYIFEPNDAATWVSVKGMMDNFLTNLWRQGALAGSTAEQAFHVQIGLGVTMTATDILDGRMRVTVNLAVVRPAEFISITFQQQMQQA